MIKNVNKRVRLAMLLVLHIHNPSVEGDTSVEFELGTKCQAIIKTEEEMFYHKSGGEDKGSQRHHRHASIFTELAFLYGTNA